MAMPMGIGCLDFRVPGIPKAFLGDGQTRAARTVRRTSEGRSPDSLSAPGTGYFFHPRGMPPCMQKDLMHARGLTTAEGFRRPRARGRRNTAFPHG